MNSKSLLSLLAATLWIGCGMGDELPPQLQPDSGVTPKSDGTTVKKLAPPVVDALPTTVCSDSVPLQGTAVAGVSVFVMGGLATSGIATDANPTTGRFCIDVPLKKGAVNTLEVRAQDPILGLSEAVTVKVTHGGTCTDDVPAPTPTPAKSQNVALGVKAKTSVVPSQGNDGFITDGKPSTIMQLDVGSSWYNPFADTEGWATIKLDKLTEIEKIVVKWRDSSTSGGENHYGKKFKVLVSAMSDPGDPNVKNGYWTEVGDVPEGTGGTNTFDLKSTKPIAQHVALWLMQDGAQPFGNWYEYYAIAELEVWDAPKTTTPTPTNQTNTCANIGSK
jgi:hypothetical protein